MLGERIMNLILVSSLLFIFGNAFAVDCKIGRFETGSDFSFSEFVPTQQFSGGVHHIPLKNGFEASVLVSDLDQIMGVSLKNGNVQTSSNGGFDDGIHIAKTNLQIDGLGYYIYCSKKINSKF